MVTVSIQIFYCQTVPFIPSDIISHSKTGTDEDFILSPVANAQGIFFDSHKAGDRQPKDADANCASTQNKGNFDQIIFVSLPHNI